VARFLVHVATGPENPTRAALGLLVAKTAAAEGHDVDVFLAGDAVSFARTATAEAAHGVGTGSVADHLRELREAGVTIHLSGMSSKARGVDEEAIPERSVLAPPEKLVELAASAETVLVY
jgi:uncharacterized protein